MNKAFLILGLAVAFASQAADYTLDFSGATPVASEAPVLRKAEMPLAVGQIPSVAVGDTITMQLFEDVAFLLDVVSAPPAGIAGQSFIAKDENGSASAIVKVTAKTARISVDDFANRRQYTVRCKDGKVLIVERDNSQVDEGECGTCGGEIEVPQPVVEETKTTSTKKSRTLLGASGNEFPLAEQKSVVDILVAFDQGAVARSAALGYETIEDFADYAVGKMNTVLANSKLDDQFCYRLVGVVEIDDTWTKIDGTLLNNVRLRAGKLAKLGQLREKYGADTITLLIDKAQGNTTGIGYGYYPVSSFPDPGAFDRGNFACNVCDIKTVHSRYTMSHETGHNMGCDHSNRQVGNAGPGRYSDSCGYHFTDVNSVHRATIMAYTYTDEEGDNNYYNPIPYFSTPEILPEEYGCVLGEEGVNNNRGTLLQTHADIAGLRDRVLPYDWDVRVWEGEKEIIEGDFCKYTSYGDHTLTLMCANSEATIYYTLDGTDPILTSDSIEAGNTINVNLEEEKTLKVCAVINAEAQSIRTLTLREGIEWAGESGQNGNGRWSADQSILAWDNGERPFEKWATVIFQENADNLSPVVTIMDEIAPWATAFTAINTAYTFNKNNENSLLKLRDANFAPSGDITFNVPVQLSETTFTNMTGCALTFNAPFGQTVNEDGGTFNGMINIGPNGTLTVAPGSGKTQTIEKLNNMGWYTNTSTFRVGEGTVVFNGALNNNNKGAGVIGRTKLEVGNGGEVVFDVGGGTGFDMNQTSLTVEKGGVVRYNDMEHLRRTLFLNGGKIYSKRLDLMGNPGVYVTDDSSIEDNSNGYILIRDSDSEINVSDEKTLTLGIGTNNRDDTSGWGIIKRGSGTLVANVELKHSGVTDIEEGTLEVGYPSGATVYGQCWIVASNSTLRVKSGCSLKVPSLELDPTATISLPAAASAPLVVNGDVDLTEVKLSIQDVGDLSLGAGYPLISATGEISGLKDFIRQDWPRPADGLGWKVAVSEGVLTASIVNAAEADQWLDFMTNISGLRPTIPEDATMSSLGGLQIGSSPIVIDGLTTNAVGVTLDVTIGEPTATERTICSWVVNGNIARCVVTNGVLDCFHGTDGHVKNDADFLTLSPGRHVINVGYKSLNDTTYGGTYVYVDGTLAYRAAGLRWSDKNVTKFTVGATAKDTPDKPYTGLVVHNFALLDTSSTSPLPNMTSSGGTIAYDYFAGKPPCVFALTPDGGFETYGAILSGAFSGTYEKLSVSVVAAFPSDATGTIFSTAVKDTSGYAYSTQVEYRGNGTFAFRDNGNSSLISPTAQVSIDASAPHLYTLTYTMGVGFTLYMDGEGILANSAYFQSKNLPVWARVVFGCGYWTNWMTSWNGNPNPISNLKVYASHIELGTDDRTVSETQVKEATGYNPEEPEEPEEPDEPDPEPPETPAVVDVLVAYDNGAYNYVTSRNRTLEEFAKTQIERMNDVLATNKLDRFYSYRLAGVCKVDGTYNNIDTAPALIAAGEGPAVSLRAAREMYGADTVTLLVDVSGNTLGNSSPLNSPDNVAGQHECAFSVCSIRAVDTGKQHTMIHENAHNMGCGHARAQSIINSPFDYGRGYYFKDGNVTRHTIMAYGGDDDASWYFSTASKEFGFTLGDKTNNNARVLKETCGEVAKWRDSVKPNNDELIVTDENGNEITANCFFKDNIKVAVTAPIAGAELFYTFDGTDPVVDYDWFYQTSPSTFTFKDDRVLKIAYYDGEKLSPIRTINAYKCANVPADGLWQTSKKYPWRVDSDGFIRSYNQTEYGSQCTTPLKATIVGPKVLSFKHKSYFGGVSLAGNNYSHFDVLLDDSPVLAQTECTNSWTDARLIIPDGTHEVTFVFSQRFAMNNSKDYKDGEPEADDAVWLKDIALVDLQTVECAHSSTSDDVDWVFPYDYEATAIGGNLGGIEVGSKGVVETLNFSTNAVVLSVLAELPENGEGALMGLVDVKGSVKHPIYAYANGDGTIIIYYDSKAKTESSKKSAELDVTGLHVWTLAYCYDAGAKFYLDGVEVASDAGIKWTGNDNVYKPAECLTFGSAYTNAYPLVGAKIYSVHSDFGNDAFVSVINNPASAVSDMLKTVPGGNDFVDEPLEVQLALLNVYKDLGYIPDTSEKADSCVLRISEIMPKPTDDLEPGLREGMDVNGLESGWVEVENTSAKWVDLKDYKFTRTNRGKKSNQADYGNFPSRLIPPYGRAIFYTSERYSNSKSKEDSAFAEGTFDGKPMIFKDYGNILVWGDKVNPKKSPFVRLYYAPNGTNESVVDTVVIPSDLPEGWSIIVGQAEEDEGTRRWMCPTPTRNSQNGDTAKLTRIGPNVGPLYEISTLKKTDVANEFASTVPPAKPGEDYTIMLPINPVMNPNGTFSPRTADQIASLKLVYRKDLDDSTLTTNEVSMTKTTDKKAWGDQYTATIPASYFPEAGHLVQWKVLITDGEGVEWTSPSFNNPDDGYEWYGTIVEAPELESATLPTWHMFVDNASKAQMDYDKDDSRYTLPNGARVAIYDSSTSNYYDYVRIDLRGNTSKNFTKKGHGLRFAKAHPLTMVDSVTGETIEEIRKTSLISEFADPSYMRQMIAFWLWRKMGNLVPFDFPVRCNLNGEFYQLAFNSERFTDELVEDVYGLDKYGYSYKNVGTLKSDSKTTAGSIEKKTPDDEDESNVTVLESELRSKLKTCGAQEAGEDTADLTKFVVQKFNLPAWINYLASARITQEMDDVWANVCIYYDNPDMKKGARGTGTWMPLGYDFNLSFGQYYYADIKDYGNSRNGLMATSDWYKSHPFYGGNKVVAYRNSLNKDAMNGNDGFEAVWQSSKFRRLYLRRLRTLMDQELKAPGTAECDTPFMAKMREMADLMRTDATHDTEKWGNDSTDDAIDVWPSNGRPANMDAGIQDIWNNYVVPRREHLYVTHSVTNTAKAVGYGSNLNAGIPEAQSPISVLAQNFVLAKLSDCVVISNLNNEVVDMSGWTLKFGVEWTLPAGTVCDSNDCIYVVKDRRAYIEAHNAELTDQVIVGNATFSDWSAVYFDAADGTVLRGVPSDDSVVTFEAKDQKAADKLVAELSPALTEEDATAGLQAKYLKVVAEPTGKKNEFVVAVAVNPETVNAPVIAEPAAESEPVEVEEDDNGKTTVSVSISNAIQGLWYGYEVSDALGENAVFTNDVDSFERATGSAHTVKGSPRDKSKTSGFFRLKVLPAKPSKTSE